MSKVLISVLKDKRDKNILLRKRWYRIPVFHCPKRKAEYIAFYQPTSFSRDGGRIKYYAEIKKINIFKRKHILPEEYDNPNMDNDYYKIEFYEISKLPKPILNENSMRISFGFTSLDKLLKAKDVMELFDVKPIERFVYNALVKNKLNVSREHIFYLPNGKRYRLDIAIFCKNGRINVECDSDKWHSIALQRKKDAIRDNALKKEGWNILRLKEQEIEKNIDNCIARVDKTIKNLGGL